MIKDTYYHVDKSNYVIIIAEDDSGLINVIRQYRRGTDEIQFELPAGFIDAGETPIEAAERELQEETGCCGQGRFLGRLSAQPGFCSMQAFVVHISVTKAGSPKGAEADENIENYKFSIDEIHRMIKKGEIIDMGFVSAIQIFQAKLR